MADPDTFTGIDWHQSQTLAAFLAGVTPLDLGEKSAILDAAASLIADHYAHLPHKRLAHGIDPAGRLRALGRALPHLAGETSFHAELAAVFAELRDLHTIYTLPSDYADMVVFLPFQLAVAVTDGRPEVIVTDVMEGTVDASFRAGVSILSWSGVPIWREVELLAGQTGGANPPAARARAVAALTQRPMLRMAPPDAMWVEIEYAPEPGAKASMRVEWRVCRLLEETVVRSVTGEADARRSEAPDAAVATALDDSGNALARHSRALFSPALVIAERAGVAPEPGEKREGHPFEREVPTHHPALRAWVGTIDGREFGHLTIRSFKTDDPDGFLREIAILLSDLPQDGLVIDLRGNPGGLVQAAERLLQFFTDRPVQPMKMQFLATKANLQLCRLQTPENPDAAEDLRRWIPSLLDAVGTQAKWSDGYPMTDPALIHAGGRVYPGPAVLLTSATSYSAADMFIAGWRDNAIGPILGVDATTGAGGANRWSYSDILRLRKGQKLGTPIAGELPRGADLRVAVRRAIRVGRGHGLELEETGVPPDEVHDMTRADLLAGDPDLLARAVQILRKAE